MNFFSHFCGLLKFSPFGLSQPEHYNRGVPPGKNCRPLAGGVLAIDHYVKNVDESIVNANLLSISAFCQNSLFFFCLFVPERYTREHHRLNENPISRFSYSLESFNGCGHPLNGRSIRDKVGKWRTQRHLKCVTGWQIKSN